MGPLTQYLKDTRQELHHVAWPTQTQTIVYTLLVAGISLGLAAYLGFFDFLFTTGLAKAVDALPPAAAAAQAATTTSPITVMSSSSVPVTLPFTNTTKSK